MQGTSDALVAVLTGDVVRSSRLPLSERAALASVLQARCEAVRAAFGKDLLPFGVDTFRGDGFQTLVAHPGLALRVAVYFRAAFRCDPDTGFSDLRIAVGVGRVEYTGQRVSEGLGPAYELSGRRLDAMTRGERLGIAADVDGFDPDAWSVISALMDTVAASWTSKQALAISGAVRGMTQQAIADDWPTPIRQQTVGDHLVRGGWRAIKAVLAFYENSF